MNLIIAHILFGEAPSGEHDGNRIVHISKYCIPTSAWKLGHVTNYLIFNLALILYKILSKVVKR